MANKRPERFPASAGWASLAEHIARELREARRAKRICLKEPEKYHDVAEYWEGNIVALVRLRKAFARELKAKPNVEVSHAAEIEHQPE